MDSAQVIQLLQNKGSNTAPLEQALEKELNAHPYFTAVRLLRLKALQESQSLSFDAELKRTAVHIYDRRQLFEWVSMPLAPSDRSFKEETLEPQEETVLEETVDTGSGSETQEVLGSAHAGEGIEEESAPEQVEQEAFSAETESVQEEEETDVAEEHAASEQKEHPVAQGEEAVEESTLVEETPEEAEEKAVAAPANNTLPSETEAARPELPEDIVDPAAAARKRVEDLLAAHKRRKGQKDEDPPSEKKPERQEAEETIVPQVEAKAEDQPSGTSSEKSKAVEEEAIQPEHTKPASEDSGQAKNDKQADTGSSSFSDWRKKEQIELVDQFLKEPPRFQPKKEKTAEQTPNIASESVQERSEFMTETLAKLYIEQGHVEKAIEAYDILRLRFPEKSSFFAGRIRALKQQLKKES
ncbi:MAG: hypothetical protein EBT52_01530 [Flavobacteriia bacterium]|nr:hypothetical protein [Flavobacteriia bacterium]